MALVGCLIVALGGVGFGHRTAPAIDADLLAFLDAGGTLADICDDTPGSAHAAVVCEACQISGSADVPPINRTRCDFGQTRVLAPALPRTFDVLNDPFDPAHRGRAPPVV